MQSRKRSNDGQDMVKFLNELQVGLKSAKIDIAKKGELYYEKYSYR
jgi:hypothetical protein